MSDQSQHSDVLPKEGKAQTSEDSEALIAARIANANQQQRKLDIFTLVMLAIGGLLLVFSVVFPMPLPGFSILTFTVGLAIILMAAGAVAGFQRKGVVVGGAGAMAIILTIVMFQMGLLDPNKTYSRALVKDVPTASVVEVSGSDEIFGRKLRETIHEFLATPEMIEFDHLNATITTRPAGCESDDCSIDHEFYCISKAILVDTNKGERPGRLKFRPPNGTAAAVLEDEDDSKRTYESGVVVCNNPSTTTSSSLFNFVSRALAQDAPTYEQTLTDLNSPSAYTRRNARKQLAKMGTDRIDDLLSKFSSHDLTYRTRLGIAVALAEIAQQESVDAASIRSLVQDRQIDDLAGAVAAKDPTLSNVTTQFVKYLADPRIISAAETQYSNATLLGQKNLLEAVGSASISATDEQRAQAVNWLRTVDSALKPEAESWIRTIDDSGSDGKKVTYRVVVGSYSDEASAKAAAEVINAESGNDIARVGAQRPGNPYYPVIFGGRQELDGANATMEKALTFDAISDAYLSTYDGYVSQ